jgi:hypothetical protein
LTVKDTAEAQRLAQDNAHQAYWKRWGPYLSNRQWGTVREDYSPGGNAWSYFPHDMARSRAYRWGEDGIGGISDTHQRLCFALALWNGADPILKERLFGLTNDEGNHGEDPKEYYFYLDNTPTHSYMQFLYKYPQQAFPYASLVNENARRRSEPTSFEYELLDTGVFESNKYFDIFVTYAKVDAEDILIRIEIVNRGTDAATLDVLPTLWFRNTWSWDPKNATKPTIVVERTEGTVKVLRAESSEGQDFGDSLGQRWLYCDDGELLFTENETNIERFGWGQNTSPFVKDSIADFVVSRGAKGKCNPTLTGTKVSVRQTVTVAPGQSRVIRLRLTQNANVQDPFGNAFDATVSQRKRESDAFYQALMPAGLSSDLQNIHRQAYAGMLWCKQCYYYIVKTWLDGDPGGPPPPNSRSRNSSWQHLFSQDVLSMPDDWEYPWFAAWDLSFHTILFAYIDPTFAKHQLDLITREWYMHPNGEVPAYEWNFGDVNPPVQAWAAWRVYNIEKQVWGTADTGFLETVFQKLMLYLTWWVNVKDADGNNLFQGGFLGLDNIGLFNRDDPPPEGGHLDQSDGTSWMGMFCLTLLQIALELSKHNPVYLDAAMKLFQHFLLIADAFNQIGQNMGQDLAGLWDERDGFYYDILDQPGRNPQYTPLRTRSMVGLIPLATVELLSDEFWTDNRFKPFADRFVWFIQNRADIMATGNVSILPAAAMGGGAHLLSFVSPERLKRILTRVLDTNEFLGPHGLRSLSRVHLAEPFTLDKMSIGYEPAEATVPNVNSNWRGPVWMPINYLIIEALEKFGSFLGDQFTVEYPVGSGAQLTLPQVAKQLALRLITTFTSVNGKRPVYGGTTVFQDDPNWQNYILFFEYFHGDNGAGLGANHQTGWSGLVADLIQRYGA